MWVDKVRDGDRQQCTGEDVRKTSSSRIAITVNIRICGLEILHEYILNNIPHNSLEPFPKNGGRMLWQHIHDKFISIARQITLY